MCTVASDPSGTWLIVSNEPEEVSLSPLDAPITLYRGSAVLSGGGSVTQRFRLFLWHVNGGPNDLYFGLALRLSSNGSVSNCGALTGAGHEHDLDNKGCDGVDLEYRLKLVNTDTTAAGHVYANVVARHVVTYFGAAHVAEPGAVPGDKRHVPQLYEPGYPLTREAVDLLQARAGSKVAVPAGTDKEDNFFLRIRVANGGACATPANIVVSREALSGQPVSGGS